ncbi:hypothetical protein DFH06DRAFT_1198021 [Mycena polygramma]|nr:hypothetical protein DFH06DRAFT_1198021 [Mycena polygramma]
MSSKLGNEEDPTLFKAKQRFLEHLEVVDTSDGLANTLVLKFRMEPEVESALNAFVTEYGCSMDSRVLSREEQNKIDKRAKTCAQYTWFLVPPEAQEEYLVNKSLRPRNSSNKKTPTKKPSPEMTVMIPALTKNSTPKTPRNPAPQKVSQKINIENLLAEKAHFDSSDSASDDHSTTVAVGGRSRNPPMSRDWKEFLSSWKADVSSGAQTAMIEIPVQKFDDMSARLESVLSLLPTENITQGSECREVLVEIAHELRELRPPKLRFNDEDEGERGRKKQRSPVV